MPPFKPYENKPHYDPGRFRAILVFQQQVPVVGADGGSRPDKEDVKTLKAIRIPVRGGDQLAIEAGASIMNESQYFVIRKSPTWTPSKSMNFKIGLDEYVILGIIPEGEPVKYFRLLASLKNGKN